MKRLLFFVIAVLTVSLSQACQAITARGTRCKRAQEPYCWQHRGALSNSSSSRINEQKSYAAGSSSSSFLSRTAEPKSYNVYGQKRDTRQFSKAMRQKKYNQQGGKCSHCGGQFEFWQMQGDHIVPYSKGGATTYDNLQMLCTPCNQKKGNRYSY